MEQNTIKTTLITVGLAGVFTVALAACDSSGSELSAEEQALVDQTMEKLNDIIEYHQTRSKEDPSGYVVDEIFEPDPNYVVLSPMYGYYNPLYFGLSHEDSENPRNNFNYASKTILGHDQFGQSWMCGDVIFSNHAMTILPDSLHNDAEGRASKTAFVADLCKELPKGTIPRHPEGVLEF